MRRLVLILGLLTAGCATTPYAWQNAQTGDFVSAEELTTCRIEADREAQRSLLLYGWGGRGYGVGWGRGWGAPGFGWGWGGGSLAVAQRAQELTAFCLRVKGFQWLPVAPATQAPEPAQDAPLDKPP